MNTDETGSVPESSAGGNVVPTMVQALHCDPVGTRAEPEVYTAVTPSPATMWEVGAGNLTPGDTLVTDNGMTFDDVITAAGEEWSRSSRKRGGGGFCNQCPGLSSFTTKGALRKHRRQAHASSSPQCPMCSARVSKQPLARHLKRVHGITDAVVEITPLPVPIPTGIGGLVEPLHGSRAADDTTVSKTNETESGRVYCQEYDCGRGFSSKAYLESHVRYFHSRQPKQITGEQETPSSSTGVVERPAEPYPLEMCCPPTSAATPTHVGERTDNHSAVGTSSPNLGGGLQGLDSVTEKIVKQSEIAGEPSPSIQDSVDPQLKIVPPTTDFLPLHCRMCDAPPTIKTQPTVTTCGHLFCFGCITQYVSSTSRCPVCNTSLLLYCLFELDLRSRPKDTPVSV